MAAKEHPKTAATSHFQWDGQAEISRRRDYTDEVALVPAWAQCDPALQQNDPHAARGPLDFAANDEDDQATW